MGQSCCRSLRQSLVGPMALNNHGPGDWAGQLGLMGHVTVLVKRNITFLFCLWSEGLCLVSNLVQLMVDPMLKPKLQCLALADLDLKEEENTNCSQGLRRS